MRIVVTGVSGQVGGALLKRLSGHEVIGAGRTMLDLTKPDQLGPSLDRARPNLLINCAAYTAVDKAEEDRDVARTVNANAPAAMAKWAKENGAALVHFSTDYVFDGTGEDPWSEESRPNPRCWYGATKLAGEEAVLGSGASALLIRTSWVYAATGRNFLRTIARLAAEKEELKIVSDQIGAPTSATLIAQTCADILSTDFQRLCEKFSEAKGLVHLTASGHVSWHGFASAIVAGLASRGAQVATKRVLPITTEDYPTPARRPKNSRLSLNRLQHVFGIKPSRWDDALDQELDRLINEAQSFAAN